MILFATDVYCLRHADATCLFRYAFFAILPLSQPLLRYFRATPYRAAVCLFAVTLRCFHGAPFVTIVHVAMMMLALIAIERRIMNTRYNTYAMHVYLLRFSYADIFCRACHRALILHEVARRQGMLLSMLCYAFSPYCPAMLERAKG